MENLVRKRSVCFVLPGLNRLTVGSQPWRYVAETAVQLYRAGYWVTILSESGPHALTGYNGVRVRSLRSVKQPFWQRNNELHQTIAALKPDVLVWVVGLTDFLYQDYRAWSSLPQVGLFPYPMYSAREAFRLGLGRLAAQRSFFWRHVLGALFPRPWLRTRAARLGLNVYVTHTEITRWALYSLVQPVPVRVIRPGVDSVWLDEKIQPNGLRARLGLNSEDFVVLYFDSPSPSRGLSVLMEALAHTRQQSPHLKMVALNRRYLEETHTASQSLENLARQKGLADAVRFVEGVLHPETLVALARMSDLAALPYELLTVDVPLPLLEALALRKPVLTSRMGALPELTSLGRIYLTEPGDPASVARALLEAQNQSAAGWSCASSPVRNWEAVGREWAKFVQSL